MDSILIIQGNDVYELDEECLKEKKEKQIDDSTKSGG